MPTVEANRIVSDILDRHYESRRWMYTNYFEELTEIFRAIKMRTKPIKQRDEAGRFLAKEDKSRTNIAMPGMNIAWRRGVARLTAQPYQLKYIGNADPAVLEMLSALSIQQYDRSDEASADRRIVMQAKAFGFSYSEVRRDVVNRVMNFKRALIKGDKLLYRDRANVMQWQGAPQDEINQSVQENGSELSDQEVAQFLGKAGYETQVPDMTDEGMAQFIAQNGSLIVLPTEVKKYEGPVVKWIFIGDLDLEPGCTSLNDSSYVIKAFTETDLWLKKQVETVSYSGDGMDLSKVDPKLVSRDSDGKVWVKAFDPVACQELITREPERDRKIHDLKQWFLAVIGKQGIDQYQFPKRLRVRKQFDLLEQHAQEDDGRMWITWVSPNYRDKVLGRMPYPDDLYGRYYFTGMVLFDDLLDAYGDSTPRMMRFLHALDNRTVAQNYDLVSNLLRRFILTPQGMELGDALITRGNFRQLQVADINRIKILEEPDIPPGALERESMIARRMAQIDPNLNTVDSGTASNPMAGKLATTAMLNAKAGDSLTQFEIDGRDRYIRELGYKKLWINQQMAGSVDPWEIQQPFWGPALRKRVENLPPDQPGPEWALSGRYGKTVAVRLDPLEIQEDLGVEPEAGSYLSVDDDLRTAAAEKLAAAAAAAPDIFDRRKVARFYASTIRDIGNPDDYILPQPTAAPPPPFKGTLSVNIPLDKMPADVTNQVLTKFGLEPSEELEHQDTLDAVSKMNEAGKAAGELTSSAHGASDQTPPQPKPNGKPPGLK